MRLFFAGGSIFNHRVLVLVARDDMSMSYSLEEPVGLGHEGNGQVTSFPSLQNGLIFS